MNTHINRFGVLFVGVLILPASRMHAQPANLVLRDTTIVSAATFIATNSITAGPNFTIAGSGDVTFHTNGRIYLRSGIVIVRGGRFRSTRDSAMVDVRPQTNPSVPFEFALRQNYPNPFNPTTTFTFDLPSSSHVALVVYDILGREVARLVNETLPAGKYARTFNASGLASGVYIYRLTAGEYSDTKRMLLLK